MKREWTQEQKDFIIKSYTKDGLTCAEIGRKFAAKADTISKYLKEWGVGVKKNITKNRRLDENYFSVIDKEEKAYFLGLMLADGSVVLDEKRNPNISLELEEQDVDILKYFLQELKSDASLRYAKRANRPNGTYRFCIRNKKLANDLSNFNIIPNKTYNSDIVIFPEKYVNDFIRGYIDGDGSIYFSGGQWHLSLTGHSEQMLFCFQKYIDDIISKEKHNKITYYNNVYKITWSGKDTKNILSIIYNKDNKISLTRKRVKAMAAQENKRVEDIV